MKRSVTLILMTAVLASVPAWAAPPFGSFGGIVGGGNAGAGVLPIIGWALDDDGIAAVDILVDNAVVGRADYHRNRPRVAVLYPGYPDSAASGYAYFLDTTHFLNGNHRVTARALSKTGEYTTLNTKVIQFSNVTHNLMPFGKIEFPAPQAELRGNCKPNDPARRYNVISGYALDAGVQEDDTGVGYVELLVDRALGPDLTGLNPLTVNNGWNSRENCFFSNPLAGFTNCYGLRRLDLEPLFPGLKDAPHSGFRFLIDVGELIQPPSGFTPFYFEGAHVLTIRAGDHFGQVATIAEIPVTFVCDEHLGNEEAVGQIDPTLAPYMQVSGNTTVTGWALDWEGVAKVSVLIDGIPIGDATLGLIRKDVAGLYLGYPQSAAPGWQLTFDSTKISNGPHEIEVLVTDRLGVETFIGKRPFFTANPRP
jgi:N-acetylmuramoyl-L-alanine amidase